MKRTIKAFLVICCLAICLTLCLTACGNKCEHNYDNDCDAICNDCGETREVGAHDWSSATCTAPKTCSVCGATDGNALGHTPADDDGDCTTAIKCKSCDQIAKSGNQSHAYGTITYTWANGYSSCTATRSCAVDGCDHTETETKTATQDGTIFTADFEGEAFDTQTIDASVKIDGVTVNPWENVDIDGGEAEEETKN
ncbi:MAG: hypothetical protein IJW54_01635 [Clostridia bacterium]|nr:hypothetical protein [Clostridia bacterium]